MWAEPETGGEAYIPLAASKRDRSVAVWEETGRRLGVRFADGGFAGGGAVNLASPDVTVYVQSPVDGAWVRSQARVVIGEQNRRARDGRR